MKRHIATIPIPVSVGSLACFFFFFSFLPVQSSQQTSDSHHLRCAAYLSISDEDIVLLPYSFIFLNPKSKSRHYSIQSLLKPLVSIPFFSSSCSSSSLFLSHITNSDPSFIRHFSHPPYLALRCFAVSLFLRIGSGSFLRFLLKGKGGGNEPLNWIGKERCEPCRTSYIDCK